MDPEEIRKKRLELFKDDPENDKQPPLIADEIRARSGIIKREIYEKGELLTKAKDIKGHGKFKRWIRDQDFDFSYQTANNFMNVYRTALAVGIWCRRFQPQSCTKSPARVFRRIYGNSSSKMPLGSKRSITRR